MKTPRSVDEYITGFPDEVRERLEKVRATILGLAPGAEESISYGIPVLNLNGTYLIYFAGYKNHISIYPAPRGVPEFKEDLAAYKGGKGTVQFPNKSPLPIALIRRIVRWRLQVTREKATKKVLR